MPEKQLLHETKNIPHSTSCDDIIGSSTKSLNHEVSVSQHVLESLRETTHQERKHNMLQV